MRFRTGHAISHCALSILTFGIAAAMLLPRLSVGNTAVDSTFDPGAGADHFSEHVLPLPDGRILLCGFFTSFKGVNAPYLLRLEENGDIDPTFTTGLIDNWVRHLAIQPDGKIIAVGSFNTVAGSNETKSFALLLTGNSTALLTQAQDLPKRSYPPILIHLLFFGLIFNQMGKSSL
jgi:hypothetical protein